jgi:hypothetical protein
VLHRALRPELNGGRRPSGLEQGCPHGLRDEDVVFEASLEVVRQRGSPDCTFGLRIGRGATSLAAFDGRQWGNRLEGAACDEHEMERTGIEPVASDLQIPGYEARLSQIRSVSVKLCWLGEVEIGYSGTRFGTRFLVCLRTRPRAVSRATGRSRSSRC